MKERNGQDKPHARKEGLVVRELADEVLVYDLESDRAHCLNKTAALVWLKCDGETTITEMAQQMGRELKAPIDENVVWFALDQLGKDHLLEERVELPAGMLQAGMSRRQMMRALGVAAVVAVPVVTSIVAPTPAQAATQFQPGTCCSDASQCLGGTCSGTCPTNPAQGVCSG